MGIDQQGKSKTTNGSTGRIMLVDDNSDNLRTLKSILDAQGYETFAAINGELALGALNKVHPELILLDIMMPGMDGYEVCRRLKANPDTLDIPVLFISALHEPIEKVKAFEVGGVDYISKPFDVAEVLARVKTHLMLHRMQTDLEGLVAERTTQLHQAQKMETIGQLTAGIAHDFNNILASILGFSELAITSYEGQVDEEIEDYLNEIFTAGIRGRDLIAQMLAFSRSSKSERKILSLSPIVKETLKMLQAILPTSIKLQLHLDDNLPGVQIDSVQISQLVMNLCTNARDAMKGKGELNISIQRRDSHDEICTSCGEALKGNYIELAVQDTGAGIDPEALSHIFDPFYTTKEVGKGTGMGLSMVRNVIHENDGHVIVESKFGSGSVFRLLFPEADIVNDASIKVETVDTTRSDFLKGCVLIVDDEESVGGVVGALLTSKGLEVNVVSDSETALAMFKSDISKFDLVITDQTMPVMTGEQLAKEILALRHDVPVILMTGYSDEMNEERAKTLGISAFLLKPITSDALVSTIYNILSSSLDE